jgi:hypothetical protein
MAVKESLENHARRNMKQQRASCNWESGERHESELNNMSDILGITPNLTGQHQSIIKVKLCVVPMPSDSGERFSMKWAALQKLIPTVASH